MSRPSGNDVNEFTYFRLWEVVVVSASPERLNLRDEFVTFLRGKGYPSITSEEFAERNLGLLLTNVLKVCERWTALGIPSPLHVADQNGTIITWKHSRFETISGFRVLPQNFCNVWEWVKACYEREFLFCCAAYLLLLGCTRIYITDSTGDGGLDLIGIIESEPLRGICFLVQSKTAQADVSTDSLFSDYTKLLLLRRSARWDDYQRAIGIDKACDGLGLVYIFASNREFNPAIIQAARDLPIMLRSGRQIAHSLSLRANRNRWVAVRDHVGQPAASLTRNLAISLSEAL